MGWKKHHYHRTEVLNRRHFLSPGEHLVKTIFLTSDWGSGEAEWLAFSE